MDPTLNNGGEVLIAVCVELGFGVIVGVMEDVGVKVCVFVAVADGVAVRVNVGEGVIEGVSVAVLVRVLVWELVAEAVAVDVSVLVADAVGVGLYRMEYITCLLISS